MVEAWTLVPPLAYLALGANLPSSSGTPTATLQAAVERLASLGRVAAQSSLYETDPVGSQDQPVFLNAAAAVETALSPEEFLQGMLCIEREFGRDRSREAPKGPRTLDLDLLLWGGVVRNTEQLTLPHPALAHRRFVLAPLAEIAPELRHPLLHRSVGELLEALADEGDNRLSAVRRVRAPEWNGPVRADLL
ncbi:MAG TPA: 2-amino-4-hydroxy-6-hydroxymethyldihydropteridine diphosphokinase [Acidobacteriaceae bacterium]|jgi:2-amino-4-hydroxy-6-hydroxymethyldihydropteridine diphosphokinase|nr:2-amino-4-hydroxy-6-hydroxymethyldihydropteridine diphosphokinase [Acidobacteriaceae bacterium]